MTRVKGLSFIEAYKKAEKKEVDGIFVTLISLNDLLKAKHAANRPKDQNDIENLKDYK